MYSQLSDNINDIIDVADMPLFVFAIVSLESNQVSSGISNDNIDLVLEVKRDEVTKMDDSLIRLDIFEYRTMAIDFLNSVFKYVKQSK